MIMAVKVEVNSIMYGEVVEVNKETTTAFP